jgi:multidrug efflux pump subunit AcrA (membrane-fusion protein)
MLRILVSLCLAAGALALAGCGGHAAQPKKAPPPSVRTALAREATLAPNQTLAGIVAPYQNVAIQSSLTEPADSVNVKEGDRVYRGEVLATLDTADLQAQLQSDLAQANSDAANTTHTQYQGTLTIQQGDQSVQAAVAAVRQAQETEVKDALDLERYRQLAASGYIAEQQVTQQTALVRNDQQAIRSAQASLTSAQEAVAANGTLGAGGGGTGLQASSVQQAQAAEQVALAQAEQVRTSIAKATIVSPIDGVVVNRNLNVGEYPGSRQLFTLQQTQPLYAVLRGSGAQIAKIATGAPATVLASDLGSAGRAGSVAGVLNQINPGSTDFVVKVLVQNGDGRLRPGMAVQGKIALPHVRGVQIPETAFTDDSHDGVMVVSRDGTVSTAHVSESADDGTNAIVAGIAPGTRVISDGQTSVGDGEKVAVR